MTFLTERFAAAVRRLVGDGPIKQRLGQAYAQYLDDLRESDFPGALQRQFADLAAAMHRSPALGKEGAVKMTVQKMSFAEATTHAETIVKLYAEVVRSAERSEPLKVVHTEEKLQRLIAGAQ
ncbi:MAG TPA: hypothetical protein VFV10_01055 [Gammaproteobacteria bacterium]|nr:hypothetical protein [Gammaproteobacteria bacterium]